MYKFRRQSIFGFVEPNEIGLSFIPLAAVLIGYILRFKKQNYIIFSLLVGITAFLTNTRYVMVSFFIIIFQYFVYFRQSIAGWFKYVAIAAILIIFLFFSLDYLGYDFKEFYEERLLAEGSLTETTRFRAIQNFAYFFPEYMIWGTGVHLTEEIRKASKAIGSSQIHVGYLSHLVSYGIVGSLLLFGFWFSLAKQLYRNAKKTNYWGSFFAFLTFFWSQATLVNYSIFFTGLVFALVFDKYFVDKAKNSVKKNLKNEVINYINSPSSQRY